MSVDFRISLDPASWELDDRPTGDLWAVYKLISNWPPRDPFFCQMGPLMAAVIDELRRRGEPLSLPAPPRRPFWERVRAWR